MIVGPAMPMPTENTPADTSNAACSWLKIIASIDDAPRPPYSFGHVMPAQPPS